MRKRKIKFALELKNSQQARSIEELREYFDLEKVVGYLHDGKLVEWLEDRFYQDEADAIKELSVNDSEIGRKLCEILGANFEETEDAETIVWRKERLERLKQYTADPAILAQIDLVAFDQDDLEEIISEEDTNIVYLCQNRFVFPSGILRKENMRYIGIGKGVLVTVNNVSGEDLSSKNIFFKNVELIGIKRSVEKNDLNIKPSGTTKEWLRNPNVLSELIFKIFKDAELTLRHTAPECMFLYDNTINRVIDNYKFDPYSILGPNEAVLCVMTSMQSGMYFFNEKKRMFVIFTEYAIYTKIIYNDYVVSVKYKMIDDVKKNNNEIKVYTKDGNVKEFPCDISWLNATRRFLKVAADKRSILFEDNKYLYNLKLESLDGKSIGDMLVIC